MRQKTKQVYTCRAWDQVNSNNLGRNVKILRSMLPNGCELIAVLKADARGQADIDTAHNLNNRDRTQGKRFGKRNNKKGCLKLADYMAF